MQKRQPRFARLAVVLILGCCQVMPVAHAQGSATAAASAQRCADVLIYTGREHTVLRMLDSGSRYSAYRKHEDGESSFAARYVDYLNGREGQLGWGESVGKEVGDTRFEEWQRMLYEDADRVVQPSIDAWKACMLAQEAGVRVTPSASPADGLLTVNMLRERWSKAKITFIRFDRKHLRCYLNEELLKGDRGQVELPDDVLVLQCRRRDDDRSGATMVQVGLSSADAMTFVLPALPPPPQRLDPSRVNEVTTIAGCQGYAVVAARPYAREIAIKNLWLSGDYNEKPGTVSVEVMGLAPKREIYRAVNPAQPVPMSPVLAMIDAGVPAVVHYETAFSAHNSSGCGGLSGQIVEAMPPE